MRFAMRDPWPNCKVHAILREPSSPKRSDSVDPQELALRALVWVLAEPDRIERFLALTGLTPDALRAGLGDVGLLTAVLDYLCANEADLVTAAQALEVSPAELAAARERLSA
jgi:Protein of unknown function (DUF3572)